MVSEKILQQTLVQELKVFYPDFLIILSMSGIQLHGTPAQKAKVIADMRKEGFRKGLPDISLAITDGNTLHLELKKPSGGVQSKDQVAVEHQLTKLGHHYYIIRDTDTVFDLIALHTSVEYRQQCRDEQLNLLSKPILTEPYLWYPVGSSYSEVAYYLSQKYAIKE